MAHIAFLSDSFCINISFKKQGLSDGIKSKPNCMLFGSMVEEAGLYPRCETKDYIVSTIPCSFQLSLETL